MNIPMDEISDDPMLENMHRTTTEQPVAKEPTAEHSVAEQTIAEKRPVLYSPVLLNRKVLWCVSKPCQGPLNLGEPVGETSAKSRPSLS